MHDDGLVRILTLQHTLDTWIAADHQASFRHSSLAEPIASFVLGTKGGILAADPRALEVALRAQQHGIDKESAAAIDLHSLLITVSAKSVAVRLNCVDTILAKAEPHAPTESAKVVRLHHQAALVLFAVDSSITVYALPDLEEIFVHRAPTRPDRYAAPRVLPKTLHLMYDISHLICGISRPYGPVSICDDATYIVFPRSDRIEFHSLYKPVYPPFPPALDLRDSALRPPPHPGTPSIQLPSAFSSWFGGGGGAGQSMLAPDALDALRTFSALLGLSVNVYAS
jgi:hypothetical protein